MSPELESKHMCPNCARRLENVQTKHGVVWSCSTCKGHAIGVGLLQKISKPELITQIWMRAKQENRPVGKPCPSCRRAMLAITTGPQLGSIELDVCHTCFFIWFDNHELEKFPRASEREIENRIESGRPKPMPSSTPTVGTGTYGYNDYDDNGVSIVASILDVFLMGRWWL